jgi:hypothetical protein
VSGSLPLEPTRKIVLAGGKVKFDPPCITIQPIPVAIKIMWHEIGTCLADFVEVYMFRYFHQQI